MSSDEDLYRRAVDVMPGGTTRTTLFVAPHPPYAVRGVGAEVTDSNEHVVIDCNNNYTSLIHGHADSEILAVACATAAEGTAFGLPTRHEVELAETLRERTGTDHWRFCNSGSEAVMMLIRAARAYTGRDVIVRFAGSYHGTSDAVVSPPARGVPAAVKDTVIELPQGDIDALEEVLRERGGQIAAVLIDLMPNRAGLNPACPQVVSRLASLAKRYDVLLAVDEVITFRLEYGGLHTRYDLKPDLLSLGKVIGGGFAVGAIGGRAEVLSSFNPLTEGVVAWGGTFSANPVTMAAGVTALRRFTPEAIADLNIRGDALRRRLNEAGVTANGSGSLIRLMADDPATLWWALYRGGVLAGTNGLLSLSTPMTDDHIAAIGDTVISVYAAARA
jgi:glutamate-1-semialdehyde 2,1-aminomutase